MNPLEGILTHLLPCSLNPSEWVMALVTHTSAIARLRQQLVIEALI